MKQNTIKTGKIIKGYIVFPIIVGVLLALLTAAAFIWGNTTIGLAALVVLIIVIIAAVVVISVNRKQFVNNAMDFIKDFALMENRMIEQYPVPYAIADKDGQIILYNQKFGRIYDSLSGGLCDIFRQMEPSDLAFDGDSNDVSLMYDKRNYRIHLTKLPLEGAFVSGKIAELPDDYEYVLAVYMIDETEIVNMMHVLVDSQPIVCTLRVDDYDEIFAKVDDIEKSLISAQIDKLVSTYFTNIGGLVRKVEKNRYFAVFERKYLPGMQRNKFDLLDEVRGLNTGGDIPVTISAGIGAGNNYKQSQDYSRSALELALGRGGDQVVLKEGERVYFYGGKVKSVEKNTRVKARVTALALKEIIQSKEKVVVMGHKTADTDCFGAAIGIYKAAQALGKKAYIVLNELNNSVQPILEDFLEKTDYGETVFVPVERAPSYVNEDTALVIVDVNRPEIFECPELIGRTKTIVMIDHHLQSGDRIDNVSLSYVEPSASSASEMITELLQYITGDIKLTKLEAEALYAGILIDTDSFTKNTGVKTFEAAAILRKSGVDIGRIKGLFCDTLAEYKLKASAVETIDMFEPGFALAISPSEGVSNPTVLAAQVANEILDIKGIRASFVLVKLANKVSISARSKTDVNVQIIMERMGGGGHINVSGAQLAGCTVEEAEKKLKLTVRKLLEDGIIK